MLLKMAETVENLTCAIESVNELVDIDTLKIYLILKRSE